MDDKPTTLHPVRPTYIELKTERSEPSTDSNWFRISVVSQFEMFEFCSNHARPFG